VKDAVLSGYPGFGAAPTPFERFSGLDYEAFRRMADDSTLSRHERSGFPDALREGAETAILEDIEQKIPAFRDRRGISVIDIGCGANPLTDGMIERCRARAHQLTLVDSPEVLAHQRETPGVKLRAGRFPGMPLLLADLAGTCDAVVAYSVLQLEFFDSSIHAFVDAALTLLAPGGRLLLADLPNASMRRRFLHSDAGRAYHREYMGSDDGPPVEWPRLPAGELDDGVLYGLLARARDAGFHAWLMPQAAGLPMANRREDLLCARP
jgi:SAM-dependent methyltransferase